MDSDIKQKIKNVGKQVVCKMVETLLGMVNVR